MDEVAFDYSSIGAKRVGVNFNPSGFLEVDAVKKATAELINWIEPLKGKGGEKARCAAIAQTEFETACMWAVKALTKSSE